jgi:hypothetical protein
MDRMARGTDWTFEVPDTHVHSRPDRILLSPGLAREHPDVVPQIVRTGMTRYLTDSGHLGDRNRLLDQAHASDHALVFVDLPDL